MAMQQSSGLGLGGGISHNRLLDELYYENQFIPSEMADSLLTHCLGKLAWQAEQVSMFGKMHIAPRRSCALADEGCVYRYNGSQMQPMRFTEELNSLRGRLSDALAVPFNYVLATLYRHGGDYVGWHADDERDLVPQQAVANISLGGARDFRVRSHDGSLDRRFQTGHGSLLVMRGLILQTTKHTLVRTRKPVLPRVVLSFRQVRR